MRLRFALSALLLILSAGTDTVIAQDYPERPVSVVVPYAAGGFMDVTARVVVDHLARNLGQPVVVDNRGGAGGEVGQLFVANSKADGYTLMIDQALRPTLMKALPETKKDIVILDTFKPIGVIGDSPLLLVVSPHLGVKDFDSFIEKIQAEPDKHTYASVGVGSPGHILSAQMAIDFGLKAAHAPYKGGAPAYQDVIAGRMGWIVVTPSTALPLIQSGQIIPLAIYSANRSTALPDVPTFGELGHPGYNEAIMSVYLMAPASTPQPVIDRLSVAIKEAGKDPGVLERLAAISVNAETPIDPKATREFAARQIETWEKAVAQAKAAQ